MTCICAPTKFYLHWFAIGSHTWISHSPIQFLFDVAYSQQLYNEPQLASQNSWPVAMNCAAFKESYLNFLKLSGCICKTKHVDWIISKDFCSVKPLFIHS